MSESDTCEAMHKIRLIVSVLGIVGVPTKDIGIFMRHIILNFEVKIVTGNRMLINRDCLPNLR